MQPSLKNLFSFARKPQTRVIEVLKTGDVIDREYYVECTYHQIPVRYPTYIIGTQFFGTRGISVPYYYCQSNTNISTWLLYSLHLHLQFWVVKGIKSCEAIRSIY